MSYIQPSEAKKETLQYKNKLVTLFDLKNCESQDDLSKSIQLDKEEDKSSIGSTKYFNFGRFTESKILTGN
jgi:hypothetical protein